MLMRFAVWFALLSVGTVVLTGAWFGVNPPTAQPADAQFVPQVVQLDTNIIGAGVDVPQLLQNAADRLDAKSGWLRAKFSQSIDTPRSSFVADGILQRGPHQCARLEMEVRRGAAKGNLVMVSDGVMFAKAQTLHGSPTDVTIDNLPSGQAAEREAYLSNHGCGGPLEWLRKLRAELKSPTLQTGMLGRRPVIRIQGVMDASTVPMFADKTGPIHARVYLDAKTLWLARMEWTEPQSAPRLRLQIDYFDYEIGRELSAEECARQFSYHPTGDERVTEK